MKVLVIAGLVPAFILGISACHDRHHDDDYSEFVDWEGSVNDEWVVDATGDEFRFLSKDGSLVFGGTIYDNVYVSKYGDLYWEDELIGAVELVESVDGYPIAALVGNDGNFLDFFGPEYDLAWQNTDLEPVFIWDLVTHVTKPVNESRTRRIHMKKRCLCAVEQNPDQKLQIANQECFDLNFARGCAFLARR